LSFKGASKQISFVCVNKILIEKQLLDISIVIWIGNITSTVTNLFFFHKQFKKRDLIFICVVKANSTFFQPVTRIFGHKMARFSALHLFKRSIMIVVLWLIKILCLIIIIDKILNRLVLILVTTALSSFKILKATWRSIVLRLLCLLKAIKKLILINLD
jgi:hypothetical protein